MILYEATVFIIIIFMMYLTILSKDFKYIFEDIPEEAEHVLEKNVDDEIPLD